MQRKMADIFALVQPQSPLRTRYTAGDTVEIHANHERLSEHGWIEPSEDSETLATVTPEGAAIINRFRQLQSEHRLREELERGAGTFVDEALSESDRADWEIQTITDSYVVVRNEMGDRRRYQVPVRV